MTKRDIRPDEKKSTKFARRLRKDMTDAEIILWSNLRRKQIGGQRFRRQFPVGPYIADFACVAKKLIVELDGGGHFEDQQIEHDRRRTVFIEARGWRVVRYLNDDVYKDLDVVLDDIYAYIEGLKDD